MNTGNRDDRFNYTKPGEFTMLVMECETCEHQISSNPMACKKYPERKPNFVLRIEAKCPEFQQKR
ncbi:MAG TPA: hypothetical protein DDW50_07500 [Firmicutes bacterium]|jgi:hypothetical protein|nr:hypothetical protein [Bacillota bacterium]